MDIQYLSDLFTDKECEILRSLIDATPRPYFVSLEDNKYCIDLLQSKLDKRGLKYQVMGKKVTMGKYGSGEYLGKHADESYQGGNASLLVYLNDVHEGGQTIFYTDDDQVSCTITPKKGHAIIFDIYQVHEATVILHGFKYILGCELFIPIPT